jgi:hypothetical protein
MELATPTAPFRLTADPRPTMPPPQPVKLVAIEDVRQIAPAGVEDQLDAFYLDLLNFQRRPTPETPIYGADNFDLYFDVREPLVLRESYRPLGIEVQSLADAEARLIERRHEYTRQKSLTPGRETLLLLDPAGNWIELSELRPV